MKRLPIMMAQHWVFETLECKIIKFWWRMKRREVLAREQSRCGREGNTGGLESSWMHGHSKCGLRPTALALPESLLEIQYLRPYLRPMESKAAY